MKKTFMSLLLACISVIFFSGFVFFAGWEVDPDQYYYGSVGFGEYKDAQFTVSNGGPYSGGGTVSITGDDAVLFSCISGCSYYLEPSEEHVVTIRFSPPECPIEYNPNLANYWAEVQFPKNSGYVEADIAGSGTDPGGSWTPC